MRDVSGKTMTKCITVLGAGAFGTALAKMLAVAEYDVVLWARDKNIVDSINQQHRHPKRFSDILLPDNLTATTDLALAFKQADCILSALPMVALRSVWQQGHPNLHPDTLIISTTKGIEPDSHFLSSELLCDVLPQSYHKNLSYLSGPSFAFEIAHNLPCAVTVAAENETTAEAVQDIVSTDLFRAYMTTDVIGVEIGGAIKNVIAIAAGVAQGLGLGNSAMAALITRGIAEMTRLSVKMGAHPQTLAGLAGLGDLVLTCTGDLSRNRAVGLGLGQNKPLDEILKNLGQVAEGVSTARSVRFLAERYQIEMPICEGVCQILFDAASPQDVVLQLMARRLKHERA